MVQINLVTVAFILAAAITPIVALPTTSATLHHDDRPRRDSTSSRGSQSVFVIFVTDIRVTDRMSY